MKPVMTPDQLASYSARCLEAGIDPQFDELLSRVALEAVPGQSRFVVRATEPPAAPPRTSRLRRLSWIVQIVIGWVAAGFGAFAYLPLWPGLWVAGCVGAAATTIASLVIYRRDRDGMYHTLRYSGAIAAIPTLIVATLLLLGVELVPPGTRSPAPTAQPTTVPTVPSAPSNAEPPAAPEPEPPPAVQQVIPLLPTAEPAPPAIVIEPLPTLAPPTPAPAAPPVAPPGEAPTAQPTAVPPTPAPRSACVDHLLVVDGVQTAAPCGGGESDGTWGGGGQSSGSWGTP